MLYFLLFRDSWQFVTAISHYFELFDRKHWLNILKLSQSLKYTFSSSELFSSSRRCFKIAENAQFISKILWFTCALSICFFIYFFCFISTYLVYLEREGDNRFWVKTIVTGYHSLFIVQCDRDDEKCESYSMIKITGYMVLYCKK